MISSDEREHMLHLVVVAESNAKKMIKPGDRPPMATPNCSTVGQSNCSRQDGVIMRGLR